MWSLIPTLARLAARRPRPDRARRLAPPLSGPEPLDARTLMAGGWAVALGTAGATKGGPVAVDPASGSLYTAGSSLFKYTSAGVRVWSRDLGGAYNGAGLAVDNAGNVYVAGLLTGTLTLGAQTLTSAGGNDAFVAKFDPAGNVLWAESFGGPDADQAYGLATDPSGGVYVSGRFSGTVAFDATHVLTSAGDLDAFVMKLDTAGGLVYAVQAGGTGRDTAIRIAADAAGRAYVAGTFAGTAAFGPTTLTAAGAYAGFLAQLDAGGNFTWARSMGGPDATDSSYAQTGGVAVDPAGHVFATGTFIGTTAFGDASDGAGATTLTAVGFKDAFVTRLDAATGRFLWTVPIGGPGTKVTAQALALDAAGNVYATGIVYSIALGTPGVVDNDPGPGFASQSTASSDWSSYVTELSPAGRFLGTWPVTAGSRTFASASGVAVGADGSVYTAGTFSLNATLDTGTLTTTVTSSGADGFLARTTPGQAVLMGRTFSDVNRSGTYDAGDAPLAGVTVYLDSNKNGKLDRGEPSTTTNPQGGFRFDHLAAGTYTLREVVPSGYTLTTPASVSVGVAAGQFQDLTAFGNDKPAPLSARGAPAGPLALGVPNAGAAPAPAPAVAAPVKVVVGGAAPTGRGRVTVAFAPAPATGPARTGAPGAAGRMKVSE